MNDADIIDLIVKTLTNLYDREALKPTLVNACRFLEKDFNLPERSLCNAMDKVLVPKHELVGNYRKVYYENKVFYYGEFFAAKFDREFMNSKSAYDGANIIIDTKENKILKNSFYSIEQVFDDYFSF